MIENGLADNVIRDNTSLFFVAGHETTSSNLSWIGAILATNPEVQEKARNEVLSKIPDKLTYGALRELTYLEGLIKETLRVYPSAPTIGNRFVPKDTTIGDIFVPAGTSVQIDLLSMGHDPNIWKDPDVIRPERWSPENLTKEQRNSWMPFSVGPRVCIGMNFTILEQKIFLVYLLKRFKDIKLAPGGSVQSIPVGKSVTYRPEPDKLKIQFVPV